MASIFRTATCQAIREIIEENGAEGRFGLLLTDENIEKISHKVVDLFEMTLELRAKTQEIFSGLKLNTAERSNVKNEQRKTNYISQEENPFPKTRNAAEVYDYGQKSSFNGNSFPNPPSFDLKLPRKRYELSLEEKEKLVRKY